MTREIRRVDFMKLTNLTREVFDNRARRGHFPFTAPDTPGITPLHPDAARRTYTSWQAFLTLIADDFRDRSGMTHDEACAIAGVAQKQLGSIFDQLIATSRYLAKPAEAIFVARVETPMNVRLNGYHGSNRVVITGTLPEIMSAIGETPIIGLVACNASQTAAVLRTRAAANKIDIGEEWEVL